MDVSKLPPKEREVLHAISDFWREHQRPPTHQELASTLGASTGYVSKCVSILRNKGFLSTRRGIHTIDSSLLRPTEAAEQLGISRSAINTWFTRGYIKTVRSPGGYHLVPQSEIERIILLRHQPQFGVEINPDPLWCAWLVGFTDGEGTFGLVGHKRNGGDIVNDFTARFQLFQRSDRRFIIEEVQAVLGCGTVANRKPKGTLGPGSYYAVQDLASIVNVLIPFFDKYPPRVKYHEYQLWREAALLIQAGIRQNFERVHAIRQKLRELYAYHEPE